MEKTALQHRQTEKDLIGVLLRKHKSIPDILEIVKQDDLLFKNNIAIYKAVNELYLNNESIDMSAVMAESNVDGVYISGLLDTPFGADPIKLANKVKTNSANRRAGSIIESHTGSIYQLADKLMSLCITQGLNQDKRDPGIKSVIERFKVLQRTNKERGSIGISTGFDFFEKRMIQFVPGMLWIIGGFTSVGKTFLKIEMICRLLRAGSSRILVISTEMTEEQIIARILANLTGFNTNAILSGMIHENNKGKLDDAIEWLKGQSLTIYDDVYSLPEITTRIRKAEMQGGIDIVFIDYLQNCTVPGAKDSYTEMSRLIKSLQVQAKLSRVTIIALSQLSNSAAREESGILEFKGAGEIAATADIGLKLNRYKDDERKMLVTIGKGRHWTKGAQVMQFQNNWTSLKEIEHRDNW